MKTTRYYYLVLCLLSLIFITSCSKDDEGMPEEPDVEIITDASNFTAFIVPTDNGQFMRLTVEASANYDYAGMGARAKYENNPGQTIPGFQDFQPLQKEGNSFIGSFLIPIGDMLEDNLKITLLVAQFTTNENDSYRTATGNTISNPLTITPVFPEEPVTSVHFFDDSESFEQTNSPDEDLEGKLRFDMNNKTPGEFTYQLYEDGNPMSEVLIGNLIGNNGKTTLGLFDNVQENGEYQLLISNVPENEDPYQFADVNGDIISDDNGPVDSIVIEIIVINTFTLEMPSYQVTPGTTIAEITGTVTGNFESNKTIYRKFSLEGTLLDSKPYSISDGTASVNENLIDLNEGASYEVEYFFESETEPFFTTGFTTSANGDVQFNVVSINETVDGGTLNCSFINDSPDSITVEITFTSDTGTQTREVFMPNDGVLTNVDVITDIHNANSTVSYTVVMDGAPSGTFTTLLPTYTNVTHLNGDGTSGAQVMTPNSGLLTSAKARFDSNGTMPETIGQLVFQYTVETTLTLHPSDYLLIIGIDGNNIAVTDPMIWSETTSGSNTTYEVTLSGINIDVITGNNTIDVIKQTGDYEDLGSYDFVFKTIPLGPSGESIPGLTDAAIAASGVLVQF